MNKLIPLVLAAIFAVGCTSYYASPTRASSNSNLTVVTVQNFAFSPTALSVPLKTRVTWVNQDPASHSIESSFFNSSEIATGQSIEFTFRQPGTFEYICGLHPSMQGTVIVSG